MSRYRHALPVQQHRPRTATPLSPRQSEVVHLLAEGKELREIAQTLWISYKTASHTLFMARERFGRWMYAHGLTEYEMMPTRDTLLYQLGRLEAQQEVA